MFIALYLVKCGSWYILHIYLAATTQNHRAHIAFNFRSFRIYLYMENHLYKIRNVF